MTEKGRVTAPVKLTKRARIIAAPVLVLVLALAVLWRGAPIHYVKLPAGGFEWNASTAWAKRFPAQYDRFLRLATSSRDVADWLDAHSATDISSRNFLQLFEDCK